MYEPEVDAIKQYKKVHPKKRIFTVRFIIGDKKYLTPYYPKRSIKILHKVELENNPKYKEAVMYSNNMLDLVPH